MKIFVDLISNIASLFKVVKDIKDFPVKEREKYYAVMEENFQLIQSVLNMVIIRLGDILIESDDVKFNHEVANLGNFNDWLEVERSFRLCNSLRKARRETEGLWSTLSGKISVKQWDEFMSLVGQVLDYEGESAAFIGGKFSELSNQAFSSPVDDIKLDITKIRNQLLEERRALMKLEVEMFDII